jgi:hypothetical protein
MRARVLDEPDLEFRASNRHIDPRFGIAQFGPADGDMSTAPRRITVGIVGPAGAADGLRRWLDQCAEEIQRKQPKLGQENLYINFPGFNSDTGFCAELLHDDSLVRQIADKELRQLVAGGNAAAVEQTAMVYAAEARSLSETGRCDVIFAIRPDELDGGAEVESEDGDGASEEERPDSRHDVGSAFHDIVKARCLALACPIQVIRRETWTGKPAPGRKRDWPLQDEASRAWNLFTALYYKAGGTPWRLPRASTDLASCFVGVSFFKALDQLSLDTAVAQVFNERGDGVVVRGGQASISKNDRQPHLGLEDAKNLLVDALSEYRKVHSNLPARVVLHKTSAFDASEVEGFKAAASEKDVSQLELLWVQNRAGPRLFRSGQLPPLRGTILEFEADALLLYTRGSVPFFRTYPGLYVPSPVLLRSQGGIDMENAAMEVLGLSKMNWNNAQLDERDPLTVRTARRVGLILKHVGSDQIFATRYAYYM